MVSTNYIVKIDSMEKEVADQAIIYYVVVSKLFTAKSN
jgi:hypothetical protein